MIRTVFTLSISLVVCMGSIQAQEKLYSNQFPISDVKLLEGRFKEARDLNLEVLLQYDVDRLLAPYRKEADCRRRQKPIPTGTVWMAI